MYNKEEEKIAFQIRQFTAAEKAENKAKVAAPSD